MGNKKFLCLSVISLSFFILCVKLSIWQFSRAAEKQNIIAKSHLTATQDTDVLLSMNAINKTTEYTIVKLYGHWASLPSLILTNQYHNHTLGYNLISPFVLFSDNSNVAPSLVLINRGWTADLSKLPLKLPAATPQKNFYITGIIRNSNSNQYIMGNNILESTSDFTKIQKLDLTDPHISNIFTQRYVATLSNKYLLLLEPKNTNLITNWQLTNMPPEKHLAYAIQWLLLAITIVLLYSYLYYKTYKY